MKKILGILNGLKFGLQEYLWTVFISLVLIAGIILSIISYFIVVDMNDKNIKEQVGSITDIVKKEILNTIHYPVHSLLDVLAIGPLSGYSTFEERSAYIPIFASMLKDNRILSGVYIGYEDGEFFGVRRLDTEAERKLFNAPPDSVFMMAQLDREGAYFKDYLSFYSYDLQLLAPYRSDAQTPDPRTRPWFQQAMQENGQIETAPFIIFGVQQPGMTFAVKTANGKAVVAADILLTQMSAFLKSELPTVSAYLALLRTDATLITRAREVTVANEDGKGIRMRTVSDLPRILALGIEAYSEGRRGRGIDLNDGEKDWEVSLEEFEFNGKVKNIMLLAVPRDELTAGSREFLYFIVLGVAGILMLFAPLVWLILRFISHPLRSLAKSFCNIQQLLSAEHRDVDSNVSEIRDLARCMNDIQGNIRNILTITHVISAERNFSLLLQRVLRETLLVAKADGSLVALVGESGDTGETCFVELSALWSLGGEENFMRISPDSDAECLDNFTDDILAQNKMVHVAIQREAPCSHVSFIAPAFVDPAVEQVDVVCIPLQDRMEVHIGVLGLFRAMSAESARFSPDEVAFIEAFACLVAVALENNRLIKTQSDLRDALIHILAGAIDAKSPHTGGHCQRVPIIFQMLLEAACGAKEGPLKDFSLNEDEWEETKLAGWLHDCGKVTTPEYVADKATKLETIYDRIHEIRTRFEVLKRDADIARLHAVLQGADAEEARQEMEKNWRALDEDFEFVASCNAGSEYMSDADIERLAEIGRRTWLRTFDKRLGVSRGEKVRMDEAGVADAPVLEKLLMDNPEHIIARSEADTLPPDNPWGFKVSAPSALYNRGELYNLSIRKGTLTMEERYKVNAHVAQSIIMLSAIPLPEHLSNIPEIAGSHHETLDGKGHPRGLTRDRMSWRARMLAVADIFEALTACDRPYKSSKTLREALQIMGECKEQNQIDADIYEIFIKADIPRRYARQYLKTEQNDL